jgi:CRISPR-associated protein Cmr1
MNIARFHDTESLECAIEFLTPTFLGGPDQNAELRIAPFKNLLRRWWRISTNGVFSTEQLWAKEAELFGSASGKKNNASKVRIRIIENQCKYATDGIKLGMIHHPEVGDTGRDINTALYIGYGPITVKSTKQYIEPTSKVTLEITIPKTEKDNFRYILQLIHHFGAIGSRSRNGWGSLSVLLNGKPWSGFGKIQKGAQNWETAFQPPKEKYYPFYIGQDDKGLLVWELKKEAADYVPLLSSLAELYKNLRVNFKFVDVPHLEKRHVLGYPITHHDVPWKERVPSQLLLKIYKAADTLTGRIVHIPYPLELPKNVAINDMSVWREVHDFLDEQPLLHRWEAK